MVFVAAGLSLLTASCMHDDSGGDNNDPNPAPNSGSGNTPSGTSGNNSSLIVGGTIGPGSVPVSNLRKQLAVTVLNPNSKFSFGTAYATRSSVSDEYAYVILPVTNIGTTPACFTKISGLTYRDASDTILDANNFTYVHGSVRDLSSGTLTLFTSTCLDPGEVGFFSDIVANIYSAVAKMEFDVQYSSDAGKAPGARVIPQSYSYDASLGTFGSLSIAVKNTGSATAQIGGLQELQFNTWYLFDQDERPLNWGFAIDNVTPTVLPANATGSMSDNVFIYSGSGSKLRVFVDFDDATATASLKPTPNTSTPVSQVCSVNLFPDALMACLNKQRNQRVAELKTIHERELVSGTRSQ